jgi:large repetitive protein
LIPPPGTVTSPIDEGGRATVSGTITDPGPRDPFTLVVNWGDGKPARTYTFPAGSDGQRVSVSHRYRDDGAYTIQLSWHAPR